MKTRSKLIAAKDLHLKAIDEKDIDILADILLHPEVGQSYMLPDFKKRDDALLLARRLKDISKDENRFLYGIYDSDELLGIINETEKNDDEIELGYVINPLKKNRGYATLALDASIKELFKVGYKSVKTGAFEENLASIRVREKCNMTRLDEYEYVEYRGINHRCVMFKIFSEGKND